ncbi:MAG: type VI secretion system baseplate subunit TssF [Pirellulales bacterium]|nr:type VI secretion system baseplate subunit TssF [Pirellulales bacterium]
MSDPLLRYYHSELAFLRRMGKQFAQAHPDVARNLGIDTAGHSDPFVERLVEAFAYLNARTRYKIEDDFPEICGSMLEVLYPHYLRPIPSAAIVNFFLDQDQADLTSGAMIPRGTLIETEPIDGDPCRFRTCYDVTCWPIWISQASLHRQPFDAPQTAYSDNSASVLRIELDSLSTETPMSSLEVPFLRFYIHAQPAYRFRLYEMLLNDVVGLSKQVRGLHENEVGIVLARSSSDKKYHQLLQDHIQPVGLKRNEGLIDYPANAFLGYRLLTEFFAFPDKFLFFDIKLGELLKSVEGTHVELYFFLGTEEIDLEPQISADMFELGCTPMVNLYRQLAEPIRLDHFDTQYKVIPDSRRPETHEVYSIDRVIATSSDDEEVEFLPFYSYQHALDPQKERVFYHASHRYREMDPNAANPRTETWLTFTDLDFNPAEPRDWTIDVETTCFSSDQPYNLVSPDQLHLQYEGGAVAQLACLTRPTKALRPQLEHGTRWRLISHLSLNHLSITASDKDATESDKDIIESNEGAKALREILMLYNHTDPSDVHTQTMINGLVGVSYRRVTARVPGELVGVCRGLEVTLTFDEDRYPDGKLFLLASVLDRFLALYASINSFSKTIARSKQRDEVIRAWQPRAGEQVLL